MSASDSDAPCRICLKAYDLGPSAILLTCGSCRRVTHHSCLKPKVPDSDVVLLMNAAMKAGIRTMNGRLPCDLTFWMCPKCRGRNPEAAKNTVTEKAKLPHPKSKPARASSSVPQLQPTTPVVVVGSDDEIELIVPPPKVDLIEDIDLDTSAALSSMSGVPGPSDAHKADVHPLPPRPSFPTKTTGRRPRSPERPGAAQKRRRVSPTPVIYQESRVTESVPASNIPAPLPDFRAILAQSRAAGKLAPPPSHFYSSRSLVSENADTSDIIRQQDMDLRPSNTSQSHEMWRTAREKFGLVFPDLSDEEDIPRVPPRRSIKGKEREIPTLLDPEDSSKIPQKINSRNSDVPELHHSLDRIIKLEDDNPRLSSDAMSKVGRRVRACDKTLPARLAEYQQTLEDEDKSEWDKIFANRKFRIVEKHERGVVSPRKIETLVKRLEGSEKAALEEKMIVWVNTGQPDTLRQILADTARRKLADGYEQIKSKWSL